MRPGQGFKNLGKLFSRRFQNVESHTFQTCSYSKEIFAYQFSKVILFQICNFIFVIKKHTKI